MPEPMFSWFMDNSTQLMDDAGVSSITTETTGDNEVTSTLNLYSVEPSQTANYTCEASNRLGPAQSTAEVTVLGKHYYSLPPDVQGSHWFDT